jgi:hypothetical protein
MLAGNMPFKPACWYGCTVQRYVQTLHAALKMMAAALWYVSVVLCERLGGLHDASMLRSGERSQAV